MRQQKRCPPRERSPEARLLDTNKGEGLIQSIGRRSMEKLGPGLLELMTKTHDELIHATCLIMTTAKGAGLRAGEELSSMGNAVGRYESVNLTPEPTEPAVELIYCVLPLLKIGLVQRVKLFLTGATVSALQRLPHLTRSGKICNLRAYIKSHSLADGR